MVRALMKVYAFVVVLGFVATSGPHIADAGKADDTLRVAYREKLESLDSYYNTGRPGIWFARQVWDTLVWRNPETFQYEPLLATSWKYVDDVTIEFKLREGVKFHDGSPFDADDVVYTLNWVADEKKGVKVQRNVNWIKEGVKVDDYTVRLVMKAPFPQAFEYLANAINIYPCDYYAKVGPTGMNDAPVGTGPYKVVSVKPAEEYLLVGNEEYTWGSPKGKAKIKNLVMREIPDVQTQVAELLAGGIDLTGDVSADQAAQIDKARGFRAIQAETMRTGFIFMDAAGRSGYAPIKNVRLRQAIAHAINRQSIVDNLVQVMPGGVHGEARVIHAPCFPTQFGCDENSAVRYDHDPEKAKRLLAEAGYPDGIEIDFRAEPYTQSWVEAIQADLVKAGIKANLTFMPYIGLRDWWRKGNAQVVLQDWGSYSINDMSAITSVFFSGGPDDYARDPDVINWLKIGDTTIDPEVRKDNYRKAIHRITERAYWLPMFSYVRNYAYSEKLNFRAYRDEILRYYAYDWK